MRLLTVGACVLAVGCVAHAQNYHVAKHWAVGGAGGWDYLLSDDAAHRLYVTHGSRVEVLDTTSGQMLGAVTGLKGTHGVALNPDGKTGYITDGAANEIVIFDRVSLAVNARVAVGTNPDGIAFEPTTGTVWAFNGRSRNVSVMDAKTTRIIATIPLPGKPEFPQVDGKGNVYVNIEDKNEIVKLNAAGEKIDSQWPLGGCESPSGMAIDRAEHRLFSVCDGGKMAVLDYASGKLIGLAAIGDGPDAAAFAPKAHLAFSSNGEGTLSVVDTSKSSFPTVQTVTTAKGARTMAYDAQRDVLYLSAAKYGATPKPTEANAHPRPAPVPDSFEIIVVTR